MGLSTGGLSGDISRRSRVFSGVFSGLREGAMKVGIA
jgi:hypothetical protein